MPIPGKGRKFYTKFAFIVEVEDLGSAMFSKAGPLEIELNEIQYYEGGAILPEKIPGRATVSDITLERGSSNDRDLYDWFRKVLAQQAGTGLPDDNFKRTIEIIQLDRDETVAKRWVIYNAWPKKFIAGDWDNDSDELNMESVVLACDSFDLIQTGESSN